MKMLTVTGSGSCRFSRQLAEANLLAGALIAALAVLATCVAIAPAPTSASVIYALNCGGPTVTARDAGITFEADTDDISNATPLGVAATANFPLSRCSYELQPVYGTERYALESFMYSLPPPAHDGEYTLALLFSEVYFRTSGAKVFDISLNGKKVVRDLDIFGNVGFGSPHNEYIRFSVKDGDVYINGEDTGDELELELEKTIADNPKICAIAIFDESPEEVAARLQFVVEEEEIYEEEEEEEDLDEVDDDETEEAQVGQSQSQSASSDSSTAETAHAQDTPTHEINKRKARDMSKKQLKKQARKIEKKEASLPIIPIFIGVVIVAFAWKLLMGGSAASKKQK